MLQDLRCDDLNLGANHLTLGGGGWWVILKKNILQVNMRKFSLQFSLYCYAHVLCMLFSRRFIHSPVLIFHSPVLILFTVQF